MATAHKKDAHHSPDIVTAVLRSLGVVMLLIIVCWLVGTIDHSIKIEANLHAAQPVQTVTPLPYTPESTGDVPAKPEEAPQTPQAPWHGNRVL